MSFYKMKVFQCETTGKGGLDYFQALQSEQNEANNLLTRFPEPLKAAVLRSVQWRPYPPIPLPRLLLTTSSLPSTGVVGRLDTLVDQVYDRYVDRYHAGESESQPPFCRSSLLADSHLEIFVDVQGEKCVLIPRLLF